MALEVMEVGGGRPGGHQEPAATSPDSSDDSDSAESDWTAGSGRHGQTVGLTGPETGRHDRALPEVETGGVRWPRRGGGR